MNTLEKIRRFMVGIYFGASLLAALTAPVIFQYLDSKTLAGKIFGEILHKLNAIEVFCLGIILFLGIILYFKFKQRKIWSSLIVLAMLVNWFVYSQVMTPRMNELRNKINNFDNMSATAVTDKLEFDRLHHLYTKMLSANMLLSFGLVFIP